MCAHAQKTLKKNQVFRQAVICTLNYLTMESRKQTVCHFGDICVTIVTIVHEELKVHTGRDWPPDNVTIATNGGRASCTMTNIKDNKVSLYWEAPALPCASVLQITIGPVSHFLRRPLYFIFFFWLPKIWFDVGFSANVVSGPAQRND